MNQWGQIVPRLANQIAATVERYIGNAGDLLADLIETAGSALDDGLNAAGGTAGGPLQAFAGWLGGALGGLGSVLGATIKGGFGLAAGILTGVLRILGGILAFNRGLIIRGLVDIGSSAAGLVIGAGGSLVGLVQRIILQQRKARHLTGAEKELLGKVFQDSLAFYNVRIVEGPCGVFMGNKGQAQRAFTLCNVIYFKNSTPTAEPYTLVHECVHVWQYQHIGPRYTSDAIGAMKFYGDNVETGAYCWKNEPGRGHLDWRDYNLEAQAQILTDAWREGCLTLAGNTSKGLGAFFNFNQVQPAAGAVTASFVFGADEIDYTSSAEAAVQALRENKSWRISRAL